ncbi:hydrogenase 4 subunit B [Gilliamella sp. wkB178]|uniref:hydrogenase 4 subunit B n=1 Tax=Gilliamella sp. wkB178 TaxID=3120259 RepID=UPI000A4601D3|nr:hydrogenase 4 subunit B [Gilliamella apicola]
MPYPFNMLLISILIYVAGGILSLLLAKQERQAILVSGIAGILAGLVGLIVIVPVLIQGEVYLHSLWTPFTFATCTLRLDGLSAFMIAVISLVAIASSCYSFSYVQEYCGKGAYGIGFFTNIFIAAMVILMVVDNAFYFIIFFEIMSLASYFLVITEQDEKAVNAGLLYFLIAHIGSILIMVGFFLLYLQTGSLDFECFRSSTVSPLMSSIVFLLAFFGFGAKAGMIPLHGWLPKAHPAAPSHASALMSGVMVKIGVFGIIKVSVDLLGATQLWWGVVVLAFGAISAVLGVLYALAEHDIKRLLAYHTVENVGIILMGVGAGMIGIAANLPLLIILGFVGALYHLLNHAVFKGLLFLGAGAIIYRMHTKDMDKMGGLAKAMPLTAIAFLIGCMAISALPPLNGFISEWYTYQSLFSMSSNESIILRLAGPIAIVMLAITGALAAMCFVKVYGICFCGKARSPQAEQAKEVPLSMTVPMLALALLCIFLGAGAFLMIPLISSIANQLGKLNTVVLDQVTSNGSMLVAGDAYQATVSPILLFILLIALVILPLLVYLFTKPQRLPFRNNDNPWACGYEYEIDMAQTAGNFTQPLRFMFAPLYTLRNKLSIGRYMQIMVQQTTKLAQRIEPLWDVKIVNNVVNLVQIIGRNVQRIQQGDYRIYALYVIVTLIILLFVTVV